MTSARELHVIVGAGPVGTSLAWRLSREGRRVRVLTRSRRKLGNPDIESVTVDASDVDVLARVAAAAAVIYNCANPGSYTDWRQQWPPLAASILGAAERVGAVLVTASNLYGYGPVTEPIAREAPLTPSDHKGAIRARMWHEALDAHHAGRVRVTEARASDYIGPTLPVSSGLLAMYAKNTLMSEPAWVFADPDQPHTWTAVDDVAATLAVLGRDERAWGSAWIVPSNPARTVREVLSELGRSVDADVPRLRTVPRWLLSAGGVAVPMLREVNGVLYQFDRPFIADGAETTEAFGVMPARWDELIPDTAHAWLERSRG